MPESAEMVGKTAQTACSKWRNFNTVILFKQVSLLSAVTERPRDALYFSVASTVKCLERSLLSWVIVASHYCVETVELNSVLLSSALLSVTLKLLVINTSLVVSREQQTTPLTSDECHQLATVRRSCVYNTWRSNRWQHTMKPYIDRESRFCLPTCIRQPR